MDWPIGVDLREARFGVRALDSDGCLELALSVEMARAAVARVQDASNGRSAEIVAMRLVDGDLEVAGRVEVIAGDLVADREWRRIEALPDPPLLDWARASDAT